MAKAGVVGLPLALFGLVWLEGMVGAELRAVLESYSDRLLVPLPVALLGSATLACSLLVLWARQWRRETPHRKHPMTRPVVLGFTLALFLGLNLLVYTSAPRGWGHGL